jgi:hypothetical protein
MRYNGIAGLRDAGAASEHIHPLLRSAEIRSGRLFRNVWYRPKAGFWPMQQCANGGRWAGPWAVYEQSFELSFWGLHHVTKLGTPVAAMT